MIPWGAVAGFVASQVVGIIWYHPSVFGNSWMKMVFPGKTQQELYSKSGSAFLVSTIGHMALAGVLNHIYLDHFGVDSMTSSLRAGLAVSGIVALSEICHVMFAQKAWSLFAIDQGFNAAVILSISAGIGYFV